MKPVILSWQEYKPTGSFRALFGALVIIALAASCAGVIHAQSFTGSINGKVTDQAGATDGPDRGLGFAVNGLRSQSSNFVLDGGENNDAFVSAPGQNVPLDSIQEFRVQANDYTAEFGQRRPQR